MYKIKLQKKKYKNLKSVKYKSKYEMYKGINHKYTNLKVKQVIGITTQEGFLFGFKISLN